MVRTGEKGGPDSMRASCDTLARRLGCMERLMTLNFRSQVSVEARPAREARAVSHVQNFGPMAVTCNPEGEVDVGVFEAECWTVTDGCIGQDLCNLW